MSTQWKTKDHVDEVPLGTEYETKRVSQNWRNKNDRFKDDYWTFTPAHPHKPRIEPPSSVLPGMLVIAAMIFGPVVVWYLVTR